MRPASIKQRAKVVHLYEADDWEALRIQPGNSAFSRICSASTALVIGVSLGIVFVGVQRVITCHVPEVSECRIFCCAAWQFKIITPPLFLRTQNLPHGFFQFVGNFLFEKLHIFISKYSFMSR